MTDFVLNLAAIIREVDGNNRKGAAALAESILDHPRFRAALADGPAVPDGREPASVTGQPNDEDLLGIACQSIEPYDKIRPGEYEAENNCAIEVYGSELVTFARAVLARWGNPAPQPPTEGEVAELVEGLRLISDGMSAIGHDSDSWFVARAAELLQHLSPPQPVPVSERLPGPEDCNAEGRCWWLHVGEDGVGDWLQRAPYPSVTSYAFFRMTHWLPAYALPLPGQEVEG